ncbi:aquaporin-like protein [Infundibulicybe gibba]|nr:aquaporin-like protein [Infundibulicybe gibba]
MIPTSCLSVRSSRPFSPHLTSLGVVHQHQEPQPQTSKLARYRDDFREYAGEFLGTAVLIIFGAGVNCQVALSSFSGNFLSVATGWAIGIAVGVWISGGGHINPAITMSMATWRGFPLRKVPGYIGAQLFGAWAGAAAVYGNYFHAIDIVEGAKGVRTLKTAGLFGTYALDYMTPASCFFSEFLATTILLLGLLAITDKRNKVPSGIVPIALFFVILGIASSLGMETGFALNPARDFGPRLLTSMVGYGGAVYTFRSQYWLWCPILAPILGAQFGTFLYDVLLVAGNDSVVDRL